MPGPWRSKLSEYQKEIAELRSTIPPTSYEEIAKILKDRHGLVIKPSSIWSFVRARDPRHQRNVFKLPEQGAASNEPSGSPISRSPSLRPSTKTKPRTVTIKTHKPHE